MTETLVLIGTAKGLFTLRSTDGRQSFELHGPALPGDVWGVLPGAAAISYLYAWRHISPQQRTMQHAAAITPTSAASFKATKIASRSRMP